MKITAGNLACERGGRLVFQNLGFTLASGGFLLLVGSNGSGKSSLLRLLAGLSPPSQGEISLSGGGDLRLAEHSHYIAHSDATKSALSVAENLTFWGKFMGSGDVDRALAAVNLAGLADYPAGLLSAGQKRRLALARLCLVHRPVWLLDEPSVGLDAPSLLLLVQLMQRHVADKGILIAATHTPLGLTPDHTIELGGAAKS